MDTRHDKAQAKLLVAEQTADTRQDISDLTYRINTAPIVVYPQFIPELKCYLI